MKHLKRILIVFTGGLIAFNAVAADAPDRPLHVLYLGSVSAGGGGGGFGGFGGSRTNYVYLPGQTLAPEAIYFDYITAITNLTEAYLKHFDAVVQVMPDADIGAALQKTLDTFKSAGNGLIKYTERPTDAVLRETVLGAITKEAKSTWEASLASRPPLQRLPGEVPNYERRPEPVKFQTPLSPEDSMRYTQVPADFDLQLFAAEPDIVKPIYVAWDERGRAWVVEARDYPHGLVEEGEPGKADIKICEDTDGDGKADKFTIFADKLNLATSLVFVNVGIIVSEARHMLYLKATGGVCQNAYGEVFGSTANGNPTFYGYLPATILNPTQPNAGRGGPGRFRGGAAGTGGGTNTQIRRISSARAMAPGLRMHPNTPN